MRNVNYESVLLILLAVTLPFERLLTFDIFGFTIKPAYLVAGVLLISQAIKIISRKNFTHPETEEYILGALVLWSFSSSIWSLDPSRTLIMSALLLFVTAVFITLRRLMNEGKQELLLKIVIWLGLGLSIMAITQFIIEPIWGNGVALLREQYGSRVFGFPRPQSTFLEPLYLANFLIWPIAFQLKRISEGKSQRLLGFLILILMLVAFILTLSRGAYLGLLIGLVLTLMAGIYIRKINWKYIIRIMVSLILAVIVAFSLVYLVAGEQGVKFFYIHAKSPVDLTPQSQTEVLQNRSNTEKIAWAQFKSHPWLGIGLNAFGALPEYQLLREGGNWQTVNNQYLEVAVELGVVGLVTWLGFLALLLRSLFEKMKSGDKRYLFYLAAVVGVLLQYFTFSSFYLLYLWVFFALIWPIKNSKIKDQISK